MGVSPTRKIVNWNPYSFPSSDVRCPVKYHHSVRYSSCDQWSRGNDHSKPGLAFFHSTSCVCGVFGAAEETITASMDIIVNAIVIAIAEETIQ